MWQGLDISGEQLFSGDFQDLSRALEGREPQLMVAAQLGCTAAALRLAGEDWHRYLALGQECWVAVPAAPYFVDRALPAVLSSALNKASSRASAARTHVFSCALADRESVMAACVPAAWHEMIAGADAVLTMRFGVSLEPLLRPTALAFFLLGWFMGGAFLWMLRAPLLWVVLTLVVGAFTLGVALYQATLLLVDVTVFTVVRGYSIVCGVLYTLFRCTPDREAAHLLRRLCSAKCYQEWRRLLSTSEAETGEGLMEAWDGDEADDHVRRRNSAPPIACGTAAAAADALPDRCGSPAAGALPRSKSLSFLRGLGGHLTVPEAQSDDELLLHNLAALREAMKERNLELLLMALRGQLSTRNNAGTNKGAIGPGQLWMPRPLVREYVRTLHMAMDFAAEAESEQWTLAERVTFFKECQHTFGHTALCLSGGGALAMYHMGICKELIQQGLLPEIISGTSGGSIVVAFLAVNTDEELLRDIFVEDIATRYPERWFPPLWQEMLLFARQGVLVRQEDFARTTTRYFGDTTFAEAYARTGRNCSITISTRASENRTGHGLLLNRITTPDVTIASAVAASCALPGIMGPHVLYAKVGGGLKAFDSCGRDFIDGTMHADVPKQRLAEMFHCNQFIISQVNPHIAPFVRRTEVRYLGCTTIAEARKPSPIDANTTGVLRQVEDWMSMNIRHRVQVLSKFGLMPTLFGFDLGPVFKQSYAEFRRGVMLVPECIGIADAPMAIKNPSVADMRHYLYHGQRAVWPKVDHIRHLLHLERALNQCVTRLEARLSGDAARSPHPCRSP